MKVYFYYPSKTIGGAEQLFKRSAEAIQASGFEPVIIDACDGWLANNVDVGTKIVVDSNRRATLDEEGVLISAASKVFDLHKHIHSNHCRVILWNIHPYNLIPSVSRLRKMPLFLTRIKFLQKVINYKYSRILTKLEENSGLYLMDGECGIALSDYYGFHLNKYIPVFLPDSKLSLTEAQKKSGVTNTIRAAWLGRVDLDFKIHILIHLMKDFRDNIEAFGRLVEFTVIGDGPGLKKLKDVVGESEYFKIKYVYEKKGSELEEIISSQDVGFAMGTSALEFGAKRVPTILLDFSYKPINEIYKYKWLFEGEKFTLGRDISRMNASAQVDGRSLVSIIKLLSEKNDFGTQCFEYVKENHSEAAFLRQVAIAISHSRLVISDLYS